MQTVNGIELNLKESKFYYDFLGFRFYFSSQFYKEKFINECKTYVEVESLKIASKYKIPIVINRYLSIALYKKIEKRGFRVIDINSNEEINHLFFSSDIIKG